MTEIQQFYNNQGKPYSVDSIIYQWSNDEWEEKHHFIQWVFPTNKRSMYHPNSPILTAEDAEYIGTEKYVLFDKAVQRFKCFLREEQYLTYQNHNWLRVTRCLESMRLVGAPDDLVNDFWTFINRYQPYISPTTRDFWEQAVKTPKLY